MNKNSLRMDAFCGIVLVAAVFVFGNVASAQVVQKNAAPKVEFEKYTLPNGLQVILHVDRKLPVVTVNEWFYVGSANETLGRSGFAHLFEHMMFQGSKNAPGEYFSYVEAAGANSVDDEGTGRGVNGTTNSDRTNYFATVPSGNLEYLLWLESDRLATLADAMDLKKFEGQIKVVNNERNQRYNQPYGRWARVVQENLYPVGHPYHTPTIGRVEDMTASSIEDVKAFFNRYYTPNNMSMVVAGDFDPAEAKRLIQKYFGGLEPGPALERPAKSMIQLNGEKVIDVNDRIGQERSYIAWHSPAFYDPGDADLDIAAAILTNGISARLNKALIYDRQLASSVSAAQASRKLSSYFYINATARKGSELGEIEQAISAEITRLAKDGPTAEELNRAKAKIEFGAISALEYMSGFGGKADSLNQYNTYLGDPGKFEMDLARYSNATAESVRAAVDKYLNNRNRVIARFHPDRSGKATGEAIDRSKPPAFGADKPFRAPDVRSAKLDNGLEIFVVEKPELPKIQMVLATRGGSSTDPAGKFGLSSLTNRIIQRGTKTRDAIKIDETLGDLGTAISAENGLAMEKSSLNMQVLKRNLSPAIEILADIVQNPAIQAADLEREKKTRIDQLLIQADDPNFVGYRTSGMMEYGPDHPYGHPSAGLPDSVRGITVNDVVAYHRMYYKPGNSVLIFVGDLTLAEATVLAKQHFGGWAAGVVPKTTIPAPRPMGPGKVFLIDKPGAVQTFITQVLRAPERRSADYYPLAMVNAVFGGGFTNRLNLNLREDKGYSYGAYAELEHFEKAGGWYAFSAVQTDKTKESVIEFFKELNGIAGAKPITEKEFTTAQLTKIRGYSQQFESFARVSRQVTELWVAGLPMTTLQTESDELAKLGLAAVNAAAAKYAAPAATSILLVGDLAKIEADIRALNLGEIVILDRDGKVIVRK
jgi:zinc protease